jgi:hypothetical protein
MGAGEAAGSWDAAALIDAHACGVLGPGSAERGTFLGQHAGNFAGALVVEVEAVQPVADPGFQLERGRPPAGRPAGRPSAV